MGAIQVSNNKSTVAKNNRRRRKKRRTEDFSSDSESSSSSDESMHENNEDSKNELISQSNFSLDDIDVGSDDDSKNEVSLGPLSNETYNRLSNIKLTTTQLSNFTGLGKNRNDINSSQIKETLAKDKDQLNNEYLKLMASSFENDIDELRKRPDFTDKSLVLLAKALQSGANMFDDETLNAILNK